MNMRSRGIVNFALASLLAGELLWPGSSFAQSDPTTDTATKTPCNPTTTATAVKALGAAQALAQPTCTHEATTATAAPPTSPDAPVTQKFGGLTFGVGVGLNFLAQKGTVASASVVNGIVRATAVDDTTASLLLESHYFFVPNEAFLGLTSVPKGTWGHGPFVAIVTGATAGNGGNGGTTSNVIDAYALGWMIGFRVPSTWVQCKKGDTSCGNTDTNHSSWVPTYSGSSSWNFGVGFSVNPNAQTLGDGIIPNQPLPAGETSIRYKTQPLYGVILVSSFSF
jgi:hypothetical protein